jgi:hypothetical protein
MLERAFYVFGIAACGTYLVKEVSGQVSLAKSRKKKSALEQLMKEAHQLQEEIESHVDGLLPQIELAWDSLDKTGVRQIFMIEHEQSSNCNDHDDCYKQYLKGVQSMYTSYVIELRVKPYQKQLNDRRQELGLTEFKSDFGHSSEQVAEMKKVLDNHGFDVKEIERQFS